MKRGTWKRPLTILAAVAVLSAMSGCVIVDEDHEGDLTLFWTCIGYSSCGDAGVSQVIVEVYYPHSDNLVQDPISVPWSSNGVTITDLEDGDYDVHLVGVTPSNYVLFESSGLVDVDAGRDNPYTFDMPRVQ